MSRFCNQIKINDDDLHLNKQTPTKTRLRLVYGTLNKWHIEYFSIFDKKCVPGHVQ